jgi:uncharacterized protein YqiB (DUF1249 family)
MQIRQQHHTIYAPYPRSYAALMEMYETNYMRIRLLCGDVRTLDDTVYSTVPQGLPVMLRILDRARHTTTILLSYQFIDAEGQQDIRPDLRIRVYHDSRQAEVLSRRCRIGGTQHILREQVGVDNILLCRWRLNRFLFKWTAYLRRQGHVFK